MEITDLPTVNAVLNSISTGFLVVGYYFIRRKEIARHRTCMIGALVASGLFLVSYLTYHYHAGSVPFQKQGPIRIVYFTILISHIILAAAIVPLVLVTVTRAFRRDFARHRAIARWTWPLWMYVSITGVLVYVMLYWM